MTPTRLASIRSRLLSRQSARTLPAVCDRRVFTVAAGAWLAGWANDAYATSTKTRSRLMEIEKSVGGRVGVFVRQGTQTLFMHRERERFAMCSTFKAPLAGFVLDDIARGRLQADRRIPLDGLELVRYSPVLEAQRKAGLSGLSVLGLCHAAVTISDNTAANLLLKLIGGPPGFTARARKFNGATRLDRTEPELNENRVGDPRDTTTPSGMAKLLYTMLFGSGIDPEAAAQLRAMMIDCRTGSARLRAGLPKGLTVGDKTGTSGNGLFGDIAFVQSGSEEPIVIAAYVDAPTATMDQGNQAHREIAKLVAKLGRGIKAPKSR